MRWNVATVSWISSLPADKWLLCLRVYEWLVPINATVQWSYWSDGCGAWALMFLQSDFEDTEFMAHALCSPTWGAVISLIFSVSAVKFALFCFFELFCLIGACFLQDGYFKPRFSVGGGCRGELLPSHILANLKGLPGLERGEGGGLGKNEAALFVSSGWQSFFFVFTWGETTTTSPGHNPAPSKQNTTRGNKINASYNVKHKLPW